jgi:predicted DNA-binding protein
MYMMMYVDAVRTQIYLTRQQKSALDERSRREHRTMADLIREALDRFLDDLPDQDAALAAAFGAAPGLEVPSRDEWDRG